MGYGEKDPKLTKKVTITADCVWKKILEHTENKLPSKKVNSYLSVDI